MSGQSQHTNELQADEEFHALAIQHRQLDDRLLELNSRPYLSEPEHLEEVNLKKQKLQLKDRMEDILRRRRLDDHQAAGS